MRISTIVLFVSSFLFTIFSILFADELKLPINEQEKLLLENNKFVITPSIYKNFNNYYLPDNQDSIPFFITSDAVLYLHINISHNIQKRIEDKLYLDLLALTNALLSESDIMLRNSENAVVINALKKNISFFSVANKILDDTYILPSVVDSIAKNEWNLFQEECREYGYDNNYLKAMRWYGEHLFPLSSPDSTLQAILIVKALSNIIINDELAINLWERIFTIFPLFHDIYYDMSVKDYLQIIEKNSNLVPMNVDSLNIKSKNDFDRYADTEFLNNFISLANYEYNSFPVKYYSTGFRFYPYNYNDYLYKIKFLNYNYKEITTSSIPYLDLKKIFINTKKLSNDSNINFLSILSTLFDETNDISNAYKSKKLTTLLSSLRFYYEYDIRRQSNQNNNEGIHRELFFIPLTGCGYVEPLPSFYGSLILWVKNISSKLNDEKLSDEYINSLIFKYENMLHILQDISMKELYGYDLMPADNEFIFTFGIKMDELINESNSEFSDVNKEFWNRPWTIYIRMNDGKIARGAVLPYYICNDAPCGINNNDYPYMLPVWHYNYADTSSQFIPEEEQTHSEYSIEDTLFIAEIDTILEFDYFIKCYPNPFKFSTEIEFEVPERRNINSFGIQNENYYWGQSVKMKIYSITGQLITTLLDEFKAPGRYNIIWNGRGSNGEVIPSGLYICELAIEGNRKTISIVLLK